jgi:hypothetical protein
MRLREYFFDDKDQDQDQEYSKFKNRLTGHQIPDVTVGLICM